MRVDHEADGDGGPTRQCRQVHASSRKRHREPLGTGTSRRRRRRQLIADKAYDTDVLRDLLDARDTVATIQSRRHRKVQHDYDEDSYRTRPLVVNLFAGLQQFRGVATRYAKLASRYESFVQLAWRHISSRRELASAA